MGARYIWSKKNTEKDWEGKSVTSKRWYNKNAATANHVLGYCAAEIIENKDGTASLQGQYISLMYAPTVANSDHNWIPAEKYPYFAISLSDNSWYAERTSNNADMYWYSMGAAGSYPEDILELRGKIISGNSFFIERTAADFEGSVSYGNVSSASATAYPSQSGGGVLGNYWYTYLGTDNVDPSSISYQTIDLEVGKQITASITPSSSNIYGGIITYLYQYRRNGGSWTDLQSTTATSATYTIPEGTTNIQFRVRASDNMGFTSTDYITGQSAAVSQLKAYVGIGGKARKAEKIYVGINGKARQVVKGYIGVNGKARKFL